MPRRPREVSESGYYHVVQRGNVHALLFEMDEDRRQFLRYLKRYSEEDSLRILAWVLMSDHFHLLVDASEGDLSHTMLRLETSYAGYYNRRQERSGHLFQGPYKSVPIETDGQLLATIDYVHRNPERAGICPMEEYRWSSYQEYAGKHYVVDTTLVNSMPGGAKELSEFHARTNDAVKPRSARARLTDDMAIEQARDPLGPDALVILRSSDHQIRDSAVRVLSHEGIPTKQLARLAGLGERTIRRIVHG